MKIFEIPDKHKVTFATIELRDKAKDVVIKYKRYFIQPFKEGFWNAIKDEKSKVKAAIALIFDNFREENIFEGKR